eukprot:PhF_6_TR43354/c0_g1_i1/m.66416/K01230/MAN1; mannosyl-oligosaccharide alpha-1,2-mannosidase
MHATIDIDDDKMAKKPPKETPGSSGLSTIKIVLLMLFSLLCVTAQIGAVAYVTSRNYGTEQSSIESSLRNFQTAHEQTIKKIEALSDSLRTIVDEVGQIQKSNLESAQEQKEAFTKLDANQKSVLLKLKEDVEGRLKKFSSENAKELEVIKAAVVTSGKKSGESNTARKPGVDQATGLDPDDENGGERIPDGASDEFQPLPPKPKDPWADLSAEERNNKRRETVIREFNFSWQAYKTYAWGQDELKPLSKSYKNWGDDVGGLGLTILDSLSTLYLTGLKDEFDKAVDWVINTLNLDRDIHVSHFETTIRVLGSILSAYELTGETNEKLLKKAVEIAEKVLWAYNTSSGIPHSTVNLLTHRHYNPSWTGGASVLSEFGTTQLEFRTLSYHTKNPVYDMKTTHVMNLVESKCEDMLCPTYYSPGALEWMSDHITLGALGDSFYEYLLKQYLLTGKTEERYKKMFQSAAKGIRERLIRKSRPSHQMFVAEYRSGGLLEKMDHLACFTGGMFALGVMELKDTDAHIKAEWQEVAEGITETCHLMYAKQLSGIAPETAEFPGGSDFVNGSPYYLLRPETAESYFYLWRLTRDVKYRDWGWDMMASIMKHCRVESGGYSGLRHVNVLPAPRDNIMQSFWMAETMKYLFLLFSDDATLDLNQWVLNTEAHPVKIRKRDPMEILVAYEDKHGQLPYKVPYVAGVSRIETPKMKQKRLNDEKQGVVEKPIDKQPDVDEEGNSIQNENQGAPSAHAPDIPREMPPQHEPGNQPPQDQPPQDQQPQDEPLQEIPPQDQPPQDMPQDQPPQEQPPQEQPPQEQPPQDQPPQEQPPQDQPPQDQPPQDIPQDLPQDQGVQDQPPQDQPPQESVQEVSQDSLAQNPA